MMHMWTVNVENDVVRSISSFSLNNPIDSSHMQGLIPSSWGRSSATCFTHSEYHSPAMNEMNSFASRVDLSGVICSPSQSHSNQLTSSSANSEYENVLFDTSIDAFKTFEDEPRLREDYANPLITWNFFYGYIR